MLVAHQPPGTGYQRIRETAQVGTLQRRGYQRVYLDLEHANMNIMKHELVYSVCHTVCRVVSWPLETSL